MLYRGFALLPSFFALLASLCVPLDAQKVSAAQSARAPYFRPKAPKPQQSGVPVVVNSASFLAGISPGGLATIFGQDLTTVSGVVTAGSDPFPYTLAGVQVTVNRVAAPLFSIAYANGEDQISFQVPYSTTVGPGSALVEVFDYNQQVASIVTDSFTEDPGIFAYGSNYAVAASGTDGSLIGPNNPAIPGEVLVLYTTGLGPLSLNLRDGYGAPSSPLAYTTSPLHVFVGGEEARVYFSGLTPGYVGLYQVNFVVPSDAPPGNLDLQIQTPYSSSQVATLPVD
jgi:uncharacterized protein (TIGR03437 family)